MKQLKYKVRDLEQNCWIEDSTDFEHWDMTSDGHIYAYNWLGGRCTVHYPPDRFDILLFTGRKDIDGGLIYDGQLIRCDSFHPAVMVVGQVEGEFTLMDNSDCGVASSFVALHYAEEGKIIGNKYDNPELMQGKEG